MGSPAGWICSSGIVLAAVLMMPSIAISLSQSSVNLGTAGNYVILTKTGISATGVTIITGDIGVSPIKATGITGFGLIVDASGTFSTSSLVTGKIYASDYTVPTPTKMTTAISNLETAYTDAATRPTPDSLNLGAGNVTGKTLHAGLYKWGTDLLISGGGVTLSGSATDIWILQISGNLDLVGAVTLTDGAKASNIFWQVAGQVSLETGATMNGILLCQTAIVMKSGARLNGRALALTAVTMDANTVVVPGIVNAIGNTSTVSRNFALEQNYPNPFNPSTTIQYSLENAAQVSLKVYNLLGQDVATLVNDRQEAGSYTVPFNALNLSSGVYFYRLEAGSFVSMKRLVFMK
jgi:hypothetical protein